MEVSVFAALLAGLIGGVVMAAARMLVRAAGADLRMDVTLMWSTMFRVHGATGRVVGWAMHLVVSALVGVVYAFGIRAIFGADDAFWLWGLIGGVIHWLVAGAFLVIAPEMNAEMPERVPAPGPFASRLGMADVIGFLVGHLAYGVAFGIAYALLHPAGGPSIAF